MLNFLQSNSVTDIPAFFFAIILAAATVVYFAIPEGERRKYFLRLIYVTAGFRILYAAFVTWGQYYVWNQNEFTRLFLGENVGGLSGYFLPYSGLRFWLGSVILTFLFAAAFTFLLRILRRHKERFFEEGEVELGMLAVLLVGWPEGVLFLALLAITVVFVSVVRAVVWRSPYTTLGAPFLIAAALTLLRGAYLMHILGWNILRI